MAFGLYGTILTFSNGTNLLADPSQAIFWTEINQQAAGLNPMLMYLAFAFILVGFGTKCGLFPMHTWLSDAHSEAPSPVSAILSAVLLNCAMLVVLRYYILVSKAVGSTYPSNLIVGIWFTFCISGGVVYYRSVRHQTLIGILQY